MIGETLHPARDEQLIMNIARGDRDALAEVYLQHKGAVYAFALSILRQAHAAEDVMQETFLQLWNAAGTYVPRGQSALPWLLGITKNTALKHLRAAQRSGIPMEELPETPGADPFLAVENRIVTQAVLQKLTAEERQIVVLHAVAGLKHREIAELLEKPLSTILNKYRRALKKLEALFGRTGMTEFELNLRLKQEMESLAPNRLEELLAACGEQNPVQPNIEPIRPRPHRLTRLVAAAAAVVLVLSGSFFGVKAAQRSVVTVDAGAEISMTVNGFNRVRSVTVEGVETDAEAYKGLKVDDAAEAFAIKMLEQHPEGSVSNGVLVSVSRANARRTAALGEAVSEGLRRAAAFVQIEPAILLQHVEGESGLSALTKAVAERSAGIDLGTAENLSVQDLLYAVESQSLQWDDASLSGTLINWRCANGSDAEQIAASYVGAAPDQFLTTLSVYSDQLAYSVRFSDGNQWNSYWVSAATGEILNPDSWRPAPSGDAAQSWTPQTGQSYDLPDPMDFIQNRRQIHDFVNFIDWLF